MALRISASLGTGIDPARREPTFVPEKAVGPARTTLPAVVPAAGRNDDCAPSKQGRPVTALLAQLVAGAEDLPVTRLRRRADPGRSTELYRAVSSLGPAAVRHTIKMI
jgi:hypothetical protein